MENKKKKYDNLCMDQDYTFEIALEKLEKLVEKLEYGNLTLDESLNTFEQGMKFARLCNEKLKTAESKIEQLIVENGNLKFKKFAEDQ